MLLTLAFSHPAVAQNELIEAAKKRFGQGTEKKLSDVDEKLFQAVSQGTVANYSSSVRAENDPVQGKTWGAERHIKADRIVWLCRDAKHLVSEKGLTIFGASVRGGVDVRRVSIPFPISFTRCYFNVGLLLSVADLIDLKLTGSQLGSVIADQARLKNNLVLDKGCSLRLLVLTGAEIEGQLQCTGGLWCWYSWLHVLVGWILTTLFALGLSGVVRS